MSGVSIRPHGLPLRRLLLGLGFLVWATSPLQGEAILSFGEPVSIPVDMTAAAAVAAGDVDGDGWADLLVTRLGYVSILRNAMRDAAAFQFDPAVDFPCENAPFAIRIADLNGDQKPELVVGIKDGVAILENRGASGSIHTGSFGEPVYLSILPTSDRIASTGFEIEDVDGDGAKDIIAQASRMVAWRNLGVAGAITVDSFAEVWSSTVPTSAYYPTIELADMDGDGRKDIRMPAFRFNLNRSVPGAFLFETVLAPVGVGYDVDFDGRADSVTVGVRFTSSGERDYLLIQRNVSASNQVAFAPAIEVPVTGYALPPRDSFVGFEDIDGDGRGDFVFRNSLGGLVVVRNLSLPGVIEPRELEVCVEVPLPPASGRPLTSIFGDLDQDGHPEVIHANLGTDLIRILPNQTQTTQELLLSIPARAQRQAVGATVEARLYAFHFPEIVDEWELWEGAQPIARELPLAGPVAVSLTQTGTLSFRARAASSTGEEFWSDPVTLLVAESEAGPTNIPPAVGIDSPTPGTTYYPPANFEVQVTASDPDGLVDVVELRGVFRAPGFTEETVKLARATSAPYRFSLTNVPPTLLRLLARATDNSGTTTDSAAVPVTVASPSVSYGLVATNTHPWTGGYHQYASFWNRSSFPLEAIRVVVTGLTNGVTLANATGEEDGVPYLQHNFSILPRESVTFVLEYAVPPGVPLPEPHLQVLIVAAQAPVIASGEPVQVSRYEWIEGSEFGVEFLAEPGVTYAIQYSSDLGEWTTSWPLLRAGESRVRWLDPGPPRTRKRPVFEPYRFYRVLKTP